MKFFIRAFDVLVKMISRKRLHIQKMTNLDAVSVQPRLGRGFF